jgi:glycosyltransferase involved in cell wall biosynthesis
MRGGRKRNSHPANSLRHNFLFRQGRSGSNQRVKMATVPHICVLVPVYNHAQTVRCVIAGARKFLPVIAVNDGSTDRTPSLLKCEREITLVNLADNKGKGAALRAGFAKARTLGFTHVISMDADGQHPCSALPILIDACHRQPDVLITAVRDLRTAGAPWTRRVANALSTFWFRIETGLDLRDTQCGYRVYPLHVVEAISATTGRYAYELELLVKAAWAGVPVTGVNVQADYAAPTSRLSHFRPVRDFLQIAGLHARLALEACIRNLKPEISNLKLQGEANSRNAHGI